VIPEEVRSDDRGKVTHQLVKMLYFARSEFERGLGGLTDDEARFRPPKADGSLMNCITFTIGHLADQEWRLFVYGTGGPENPLLQRFATGRPFTDPPLSEILALWEAAKSGADQWLSRASDADMEQPARDWWENLGTCVMRTTYHYFFHAGEINATRQILGHPEIPFIGILNGKLEFPLTPP